MARLLQTLSSCRTEYFGRLGMVKVGFGSKGDNGGRSDEVCYASKNGHCRATPACPQHAQEQNTRPSPLFPRKQTWIGPARAGKLGEFQRFSPSGLFGLSFNFLRTNQTGPAPIIGRDLATPTPSRANRASRRRCSSLALSSLAPIPLGFGLRGWLLRCRQVTRFVVF